MLCLTLFQLPAITVVSCSGDQQHILRCSYEAAPNQCDAVVVDCGEFFIISCVCILMQMYTANENVAGQCMQG